MYIPPKVRFGDTDTASRRATAVITVGDETGETMNHKHQLLSRRHAITALIAVFVLVASSAAITLALRRSANAPSYKVIETGVVNPSSATLGFADSDLYGMSPDDMNRTLDLMRSTGVSTVRIIIPWADVQPAADQWNWSKPDGIVDAAMARGMGVLAVLNSTPAWAATAGTLPYSGKPTSSAAYGDYAARVADRYRGRISAYEVWNEENSVLFWTPTPDAAAFTELLKAAYPKIKAADPAATVIAGGYAPVFSFFSLTLSPIDYTKGIYAAGAKGNFDALAFHPYLYSLKFSAGAGSPLSQISPLLQAQGMHQVMADNGDGGKKIWATEYGEPTSSVDEATQADYIRDFVTKWRTLSFAGPVFIYTTRDRNTGSSADADTLGVYRSDWTPKPAQQAVQSLATGA